jgi:hypothetical protein
MLFLLKPWRRLEDLKESTETFEQAFQHFMSGANDKVKIVLENIQCFYDCADQANADASEHENSMSYAAPIEEDLREQLEIVRHQDVDPTAGLTEQDVRNALNSQVPQREQDFAMRAMCVAENAGLTMPGIYDLVQEPVTKICTVDDLDIVAEWDTRLKAITREFGDAALTVTGVANPLGEQTAVLAAVPAPAVNVIPSTSDNPSDQEVRRSTATACLRDLLNEDQRRAHDIIVECLDNVANGKS